MDVNIAVIAGGASPEAEVSRSSAAEVVKALRQRHTTVTLLELDEGLAGALADADPEVVFPVLHGPPGEDGTVQGFLEILGYPYVGSDVRGSAIGMDKHASKALFRAAGLPVLDEILIGPDDEIESAVAAVRSRFGDAVAVKPTGQGSALGTTPMPNGGDLPKAIAAARRFGGPVMVEPFAAAAERLRSGYSISKAKRRQPGPRSKSSHRPTSGTTTKTGTRPARANTSSPRRWPKKRGSNYRKSPSPATAR